MINRKLLRYGFINFLFILYSCFVFMVIGMCIGLIFFIGSVSAPPTIVFITTYLLLPIVIITQPYCINFFNTKFNNNEKNDNY